MAQSGATIATDEDERRERERERETVRKTGRLQGKHQLETNIYVYPPSSRYRHMCFEYRTTIFLEPIKKNAEFARYRVDKHNNYGIRFDKGDKQITADCRLNEAELIW